MPIGELSLPAWLGPGEPAGAPLLRGAQAGGIISQNFLARRQQRMREKEMELDEKERRAVLAGQFLKNKAAEQDMQLTAIKMADALKQRDDQVQAEGALSTFGERIRRAKIIGPNEPTAQAGVIEWAQRYRGLLTLPAGKALWEDYLNSVEEDRKHAAQLDLLKQGVEERAAIQASMIEAKGDQATELEETKQANRLEVEKLREQLRRDLAVSGTRVSRGEFINRQLRNFTGAGFRGESTEKKTKRYQDAANELGKLYDDVLSESEASKPSTKTAAPSTTPTRPKPVPTRVKRKSDGATFLYHGEKDDIPLDQYDILP